MTHFHVGTAGWDYKDWLGPFYPKKLAKYLFLQHYAKYFDFVEVNSSFYSPPSLEMTENWNSRVSDSFRFCLKVWQNISHQSNNPQLEIDIDHYMQNIKPLKDRIDLLILQFPPWFTYSETHEQHLKVILNTFPKDYNIAVEFRDNSWFEQSKLKFLNSYKNIIVVTSYLQNLNPFYPSNQEIYYIRLIGDRELNTFNKVQKNRKESMEHLYANIKELQKSPDVREIFIIVNNHFSGFAPETANQIKKDLNLPVKNFSHQVKLFDYMNKK